MLRNEKEKENKGFPLRLFNSKNSSDIETLYAEIDAEITQSDGKNMPLIHKKMVTWLKKYVNSPDFINFYNEPNEWLELMAEATFWSVKLGLEPFFAKMSCVERNDFHPISRSFWENAERTKLIEEVCKKLVKPKYPGEAYHALALSVECIYVHNNSFEKLQEEDKLYLSSPEYASSCLTSINSPSA